MAHTCRTSQTMNYRRQLSEQEQYNAEMVKMVEKRNHHLAVVEYRNDIHNHIVNLDLDLEENVIIDPHQDQVKILRPMILNSLLDVCYRLNWTSSTFSLAVHLFDYYTSNTTIDISNCRLIGFCCLWISSKYNENKPKGNILNALIKRSGHDQSAKQTFLKIELDILKTRHWDLSYPTPELFLDVFLNIGEPNNTERRLGSLFLCDIALFSIDIVSNYSSSSIAASSIMITNFAMLNLRLKHIRQHRFDELESLILNQVVKLESSIKLKYLDSKVISHKNNNVVIHNLIYLAQCFVKQKEEEKEQLKKLKDFDLNPNMYYNSNGYLLNTSLNENGNLSFFPISPIASPTTLPNNSFVRSTGDDSPQMVYSKDDMSNGRHSRSQSMRSTILPTPGTTPTASFNLVNSSSNSSLSTSTSSSSVSSNLNDNPNELNPEFGQYQKYYHTPQIYTPVQLLPHPLLYSHTHLHNHHLSLSSHPSYSQRFEFSRSTTPENMTKGVNINSRQKYQRTLPVLTRSRAREFVGNVGNEVVESEPKRRRI